MPYFQRCPTFSPCDGFNQSWDKKKNVFFLKYSSFPQTNVALCLGLKSFKFSPKANVYVQFLQHVPEQTEQVTMRMSISTVLKFFFVFYFSPLAGQWTEGQPPSFSFSSHVYQSGRSVRHPADNVWSAGALGWEPLCTDHCSQVSSYKELYTSTWLVMWVELGWCPRWA